MRGRAFRFMCSSCYRSQSNQTCYQFCQYCNTDWLLLKEIGQAIRAAMPPDKSKLCDVELAARAWRDVCRVRFPDHLRAAERLIEKCSTHIQLDLPVPDIPRDPQKPDWDDDDVPF